MVQAIVNSYCQPNQVLSRDNLNHIIKYLKKQGNESDLGGLVNSLEEGLKNEDSQNTTVSSVTSNDHYHRNSTHHHSIALKTGSSKFEAGEHDDGEVKVLLPDLVEIEEHELRRKRFYERKSPRLVSAGVSGLFGVFGITDHGGILCGGKVFGGNSANEIPINELFETGEHDDEEVTLKILGKSAPDKNLLILPNGIKLTYGEIIGFAGDFYGIPEWPICEEVNGTSYKSRFMDAFNTLGRGDVCSIRKELTQIQHILTIEKNSVATVLGHGDPSIPTVLDKNKTYNQPSDVYRHHGLWFTIQYDTILGGSWVNGIPVKFGRMMKLAENNPDHFQPYSRKVWEAGHRIALQKAEEARLVFRARRERREEAMGLLNEAYAISAFSCHFLTDSFSAGHIRLVHFLVIRTVLFFKSMTIGTLRCLYYYTTTAYFIFKQPANYI